MYKVIFFKFFLFIIYFTAGLVNKYSDYFTEPVKDDTEDIFITNPNLILPLPPPQSPPSNGAPHQPAPPPQINDLNKWNLVKHPNQIGIATNWVNPFITRYKTSTTTTTTTTTTTKPRKTARPRTTRSRFFLLKKYREEKLARQREEEESEEKR